MLAPEDESTERAGAQVRDAVGRLTRELGAGGIEAPGRDARLLVAAALGATAADLLREPARPLSETELRALDGYLQRRLAREPVSRILGSRAFFGREFQLGPETLDPRPCSETLIEAALDIVDAEGRRAHPLRILDVGTGSGCLLLTLLAELPNARGLGTDISAAALRTAGSNAHALGLASRARFEVRNYLGGLDESFDLLVSNPPYIASRDIAALEPEVGVYDPRAALDGGADGLEAFRVLALGVARAVPRGWVLLEVGAGQAGTVAEILRSSGAASEPSHMQFRKDLGGHVRCVAFKTHS